jgi:hypothetical protein
LASGQQVCGSGKRGRKKFVIGPVLTHAPEKSFAGLARRNILILLWVVFLSTGCGYRVQSSIKTLPAGLQSLGIPTLKNNTNQYRIEQQITAALLKEFSSRTRTPVNSKSSGVDAVLAGELLSVGFIPAAFGSQESTTIGSAFLVSVQISVKLIRLKDSAILFENGNFVFRERYIINSSLSDFFSEENPALERLASDFASSLASTILEAAKR